MPAYTMLASGQLELHFRFWAVLVSELGLGCTGASSETIFQNQRRVLTIAKDVYSTSGPYQDYNMMTGRSPMLIRDKAQVSGILMVADMSYGRCFSQAKTK